MDIKYLGKKIHSQCSSWHIKRIFYNLTETFSTKVKKFPPQNPKTFVKLPISCKKMKFPANFALDTLTALAAQHCREKLSKTVRNTPAQNPKKSSEKTFFNKLFHRDVFLDTENAVTTTLWKVLCWKYCSFHKKSTKCN